MFHTNVAEDTDVIASFHDDLRLRIKFKSHDALTGGHHGHEETFLSIRRDFGWPHQYQSYAGTFVIASSING